ncbi:hypothetical protein MLD38_020232 [Melastoma candidum]|uniref:Uncharacterized protein n=1 Tax=Melastoma candidum TaxID=119954 RepID=A0ACB9QCP2_9MYRT|nr:hypothetical protein MLD38_020232 [Melastoma candidum]
MAPNPRASAALTTMKSLGIGKEKVKPVLKRLLKLYDKNWELIEEDGYRALVDAIFEEEEEEDNAVKKKRKSSTDDEDDEEEAHPHELERKKMRYRNPDCLVGSPSTQPKMEGREGIKDKGKQPISPNDGIYSRDNGIKSRSSGIVLRERQYETRSCLVASRDASFGDEAPLNEPPIAMMPPDSSLMVESSHGNPSGGGYNTNRSLVLYNAGSTNGVVSSENDIYHELDGPVDGHRPRMPQPGAIDGIRNSDVLNGASDNTRGHMRCFNDGDDITKGEETKKISWVNEVDEHRPPFFHYIPQSVIFKGACVDFTLSGIEEENCCSDCSGDCLPSLPCACASTNGGEFVYTVRGLVKEGFLQKCIANNRDPQKRHNYFCKECPLGRKDDEVIKSCKGHQRRRFIKECWSKCGCSKSCGNRLVQRGITCNLQVYMTSEGKDWGLRTLDELPKGAFVCEYVGEILTIKEWNKRKIQADNHSKHTHGMLLDSEWAALPVKDDEALCLDATFYGNIARFINHRCYDANLIEIPIEVESAKRHFYRVALFTTRKVTALEELTWDYGIDFDASDQNVRPFKCLCGSKFCRQTKRQRVRAR